MVEMTHIYLQINTSILIIIIISFLYNVYKAKVIFSPILGKHGCIRHEIKGLLYYTILLLLKIIEYSVIKCNDMLTIVNLLRYF